MNMNIIGHKACSYLKSCNKSVLRCMTSLPSAQVSSTSEPVEPELDSLYKTIELELRGNEPAVLTSFAKFATTAGTYLDVESKSWSMRKPIHERLTVLKSVHIYKKHRVQYETRTYYMFVQYNRLTGSTADTLLEYVQRNLPEGVALKTTKIELLKLPEHIKLQENTPDKVQNITDEAKVEPNPQLS